MKKIFAIALALVMVLSMASAFASPCTAGFDWTCATTATNCGKATVEVIPYVKTNAACNGSAFVQSDCAAAINGENVYYAIKVTVDEDVDLEWFNKVKFELSVKGMKKNYDDTWKVAKIKLNKDESEDGWVYYYVIGANAWFEATENDEFEIDDVMNKSVVKEFAKAKVCMTLKSASNGKAGTVGDYYVVYTQDEVIAYYTPDLDEVVAKMGADRYEDYVQYKQKIADKVTLSASAQKKYNALKDEFNNLKADQPIFADTLKVYSKKGGDLLVTYFMTDDKVTDISYTKVCGEAAYETIKAFFGLDINTCVDADLIAANFGWDEKVKSCYEWKTQNATAIVDTECVVAIPKTGDASVLAWLF